MQIIKNTEKQEIDIVHNGTIISKLYFIPSYFIWEISKPLILTENDDKSFFDNLNWLMKQSYYFPHQYSFKDENKLVWFSEHCFDIDDKLNCDLTPRLIIEKENDIFKISYSIPYIKENRLLDRGAIISFAPAGNGYLTKNIGADSTFQDDLINVFYQTLENKSILKSKVKVAK